MRASFFQNWLLHHSFPQVSCAGIAISLALSPTAVATEPGPLVLTEFMADNGDTLEAPSGGTPPWIEIHNASSAVLSLDAFRLTTDPDGSARLPLPPMTISPGEHRVLFLGDDRDEIPLSLPDRGGYLALLDERGAVLTEYVAYPEQREDVSYGVASNGARQYFPIPSAGRANASGVDGFVRDTQFSVKGGFFQEPFELEISTKTPGALIRYTSDGSVPGIFNTKSQPYNGPIPINGTTVIRAIAFKSGYQATNIDTQTYLFLDDVIHQPEYPEGFPESWGDGPGRNATMARQSDYEMDPRIRDAVYVDFDGNAFGLREALEAMPTLSLVIDPRVMWDPETGIHALAENKGREWERPVSVEYFDRDGNRVAHANAGIRMQGGWNRFPEMLKKSFRLYFRTDYGARNFQAPLFDDTPVEVFDTLILRSGNGKAWPSPWRPLSGSTNNSLERTTYLRDEFARVTHGEMGHPTAHGSFVHLYLNGLYWGLYNLTERLDEHFGKRYFKGDADDQDVIKWIRSLGRLVNAGTETAWLETLAMARSDSRSLETFQNLEERVNMINLIDYMLTNFYIGNTDWPDNNAYIIRPRLDGEKWHFFCWDSEESLVSVNANQLGVNHPGNLDELYQLLRRNPEFQILIHDRVHKLFFNGGALTDERSIERLMRLARLIDRGIVGESARWGDLLRPTRPYTRDDWVRELTNLRENFFGENGGSSRNQITLDQLESAGLWSRVDTPLIDTSGAMTQGEVAIKKRSIFSAPAIYYTVDGSDPRAPGGAIGESARPGPAVERVGSTLFVRARSKLGESWGPVEEALVSVAVPATGDSLRISEIMYHPDEDGDAEFLELHNRSDVAINLRGSRFIEGIDLQFAGDTLLEPGEFAVVVSDRHAFEKRYGEEAARIVGEFGNGTKLSNGGESVRLVSVEGETIAVVEYDDSAPWPSGADGNGSSLVLRQNALAGNANGGAIGSWRLSALHGGSPGQADPVHAFSGDPEGDDNRDGYANWLSYALSSDGSHFHFPTIRMDLPASPQLEYHYRLGAEDVVYTLEWSRDLTQWQEAQEDQWILTEDTVAATPGLGRRIYRLEGLSGKALYLRLRVSRD